jgi:hypothetical protein
MGLLHIKDLELKLRYAANTAANDTAASENVQRTTCSKRDDETGGARESESGDSPSRG